MSAYYNEREPYAAQWLRNLIAAGHIAHGIVDERDIRDVMPDELMGFTQCHFFAGIGVWSHALRRAGWSDDRPIWTGSCPCQPFSAAGARAGFDDKRHLWPHWYWLIEQCKPPVVVGEQVASKDGLGWLDLVSTDMEASDYAFGAADLCAAGFSGAHIRQRLYFVGLADGHGDGCTSRGEIRPLCQEPDHEHGRATERLADTESSGRREEHQDTGWGDVGTPEGEVVGCSRLRTTGGMAHPPVEGRGQTGCDATCHREEDARRSGDRDGDGGEDVFNARLVRSPRPSAPMLGRNPADWIFCRDGRWRPTEPGTFPLVDATPARVGRLRAFGNALDAETATGFIQAVMDVDLD